MIAVMFEPGTTVEQKTEAIAAIDGCVVGGAPTRPGNPIEGFYLVRIQDDGTMEPARRTMSKLHEFSFVIGVLPLTTNFAVDNNFEPVH